MANPSILLWCSSYCPEFGSYKCEDYVEVNPFKNGFIPFYQIKYDEHLYLAKVHSQIIVGFGGGNETPDGEIKIIAVHQSACEFLCFTLESIQKIK